MPVTQLDQHGYRFWAQADYWTLEEAAYLLNGSVPVDPSYRLQREEHFQEEWEAQEALRIEGYASAGGQPPFDGPDYYDDVYDPDNLDSPIGKAFLLLERAVESGGLKRHGSGVRPIDVVQWVDKQDLLQAVWEPYFGKLGAPSKVSEDHGQPDESRDSSTWKELDWVTVPRAAEILKRTTRTVYRYVERRKITQISPGRISVASLKKFLDIVPN